MLLNISFSDVLSSDGWDHMFLNQSGYLHNGLTLINYDPPPRRVIDIGCGFGHWLITAAQQWPVC